MSRSPAPYGMLLDRDLKLEYLDAALEIAISDPDPKTNRRLLTVVLRDLVGDQEAEGKTKKCLTRVWLNPPSNAAEMIRWARQLRLSQDSRNVLHFGALLATFPFVGTVARLLGQHLSTDGFVLAKTLRDEVRRSLGDRSSIDVAARKAYSTFRHLGIITQQDQLLRPADPSVVAPPELSGWLSHAILLSRQADSVSASGISTAPELLGIVHPGGIQRSYPLTETHTQADGPVLVQRQTRPPVELVQVGPNDPLLQQVVGLWRTQRKWLGFLPTAGFTDRAAQGTLLAAVIGNTLVGYVLYDLPGDRVKIVHLCVSELQRGKGIAHQLVDALSEQHSDRRGIQLACRRDFPANEIWPLLGFVAKNQRPGRSQARLPLTIWFRDHGHPDLFSFVADSEPNDQLAVALDYNIVKDLLTGRPEAAQSLHLEDPWLTEYITLCVTDEVEQEIDKCENAAERKRMRGGLNRFRRLVASPSSDGTTWMDLLAVIEEAAPRAEPADHRHVARAVAAGATHFITRDKELNDVAEQILAAVRIQIMRPEELISHADRIRSHDRYEPKALHSTSYSIVSAIGNETKFITTFLNYADGERRAELEAVLRAALAEPADYETLVVIGATEGLLGGCIRQRKKSTIEVQALRVGGTDRTSYAVARQLVFLQRELAGAIGKRQVWISDRHPSSAVQHALALEGFRQEDARWLCDVTPGVASISDLRYEALSTHPGPTAMAAILEHSRWPLKVVNAGLPTFLVPIQHQWAEQLFDSNLAAGTLFGREAGLGLSREHVYYRKPRNGNGISPPARLMWYVSGRSGGQAEGSIRAVSRLKEVVIGRPLTLYKRFAQLGIYGESQVKDAADSRGQVMALRFIDTELLEKPIGLSKVRSIFENEGTRFVAPMSPRRIEERLFVRLYEESSAYAHQ